MEFHLVLCRYNMKIYHQERETSGFKRGWEILLQQTTVPLLNIELDHIIPDELHLMLRNTDEVAIDPVTTYDQHQHEQMQQLGHHHSAFNKSNGPILQKL